MPERTSSAVWDGNLKQGHGQMQVGSGPFQLDYSAGSRFQDNRGTNPEELVAAAHAGCFSMALAHALAEQGHQPQHIETTAKIHLEKTDGGFSIPTVELQTTADVPQIDDTAFQQVANQAKETCPISKLLAGAKISLDAKLVGTSA